MRILPDAAAVVGWTPDAAKDMGIVELEEKLGTGF